MTLSNKKNRNQTGFTLIELLMVIAIIGVLSSLAVAMLRKSQIDAKEAATNARISQIESILQMQLEDYEVRRLPIALREIAAYCNLVPNWIHADIKKPGTQDNLVSDVRNMKRRILLDIINAEMPRPLVAATPSGFAYNPDVGRFPTTLPGVGNPVGFRDWLDLRFTAGSPSLSNRLSQLFPAKVQSWQWIAALPAAQRDTFDLPGEYLYQILARIDLDGTPAVELLGNATIGNSDQDDFLEVVDAWGDPMSLRIWQVKAEQALDGGGNPVVDVWNDVDPFDFEETEPLNPDFPLGYTVIDPTFPREISKIRFEVRSTNLFDKTRN